MIRRFVNIVTQNYKGVNVNKFKTDNYSLHRVNVGKHLFYPSRDDAQLMPLVADAQDGAAAAGCKPLMIERLELQTPTISWRDTKLEFFGLVRNPFNSDGRILFIEKGGGTLIYDIYENCTVIMPGLREFEGPVPFSVSMPRDDAMEDDMYIMHHVHDKVVPRFSVLRFCDSHPLSYVRWESLPPPPFVYRSRCKQPIVRSYMVMDRDRIICVSSAAEGIGGTYSFDTVSLEWRHSGDWELPFYGRAEYVPDFKLWLGFSLYRPGHLCASKSGLFDIPMDQQQSIIWQDHTPEQWVATSLNLVSLGSGRFVVAKVFKAHTNIGEPVFLSDKDIAVDEFVVLTGVELGGNVNGDNSLQRLQMFMHKSFSFVCANSSIHCVL